MKFECPNCQQPLLVEPDQVGETFSCPACGKPFTVPQELESTPEVPDAEGEENADKNVREVWEETDPSNPGFLLSLGIGAGLVLVWYLLLLPFVAPESKPHAEFSTMNFIASLFYGHFAVSVLNTLFFFWAMAIVYLKAGMLKRQKLALMIDVLPETLGERISLDNVGSFIDYLYALPAKLRDSMMVNRIRKALEYFQVCQNSADVREMMASQSDVDAARISGSFTLLRAFLWAIPLLGFIGTVVGLSHAIGGMNFSNVSDITKVVELINNVTSGLGTAFDATLLGLVLAMTLNFPLNWMAKQEDDNLSEIDTFCNEVLLPRLVDGREHAVSDAADPRALAVTLGAFREEFVAALGEMSRLTSERSAEIERGIRESQREFLETFREVGAKMMGHAERLETKTASYEEEMLREFVAKTEEMRAGVRLAAEQAVQDSLGKVAGHIGSIEGVFGEFSRSLQESSRQEAAKAERVTAESLEKSTRHLAALEAGITTLNATLKETLLREFVAKTEEMRAGVRLAAEQAVQDSLGKVAGHVSGVEGAFRDFSASLLETSR